MKTQQLTDQEIQAILSHEDTAEEIKELSQCMCSLEKDNLLEAFNELNLEVRYVENFSITYECEQTGTQEWMFNFNMN
jgi:hypothetical protein